jgi:hypothetical protein
MVQCKKIQIRHILIIISVYKCSWYMICYYINNYEVTASLGYHIVNNNACEYHTRLYMRYLH